MKKDCKFCDKQGLMILPLRYSVAVSEQPAELSALPKALPSTLGNGVADFALTNGRYAPALMRTGYLYVLIERKQVKSWEGYYVTDDAYLYKFPVDAPPAAPVAFSCDPVSCGIDASMVSIDKANDVEKVYFLFTPYAMTRAKLDEYKKDPDGLVKAGKMQIFRPKAWLAGTTDQHHSLVVDQVPKHTVDWVLASQGAQAAKSSLGRALARQLFLPVKAAFGQSDPNEKGNKGPSQRLTALLTSMRQRKAAAFVVHDPIGITQELNDFRNAPVEGLQHYLATEDEYGINNQHRLNVYEAIQEVKSGVEKGIANDEQEFQNQHQIGSDRWFEGRRRQAAQLRAMGREADARAVERDVEVSLKARAENYRKALDEAKANGVSKWQNKYENRLDTGEMRQFKQTLDSHTRNAYAAAERRLPDHLKWFESDRLVNAFDAFDPNDKGSGFSFTTETTLCTLGLSSCKVGQDKIDAWLSADTVERRNLYMRNWLHNQNELISAAKQAFADIKAAAAEVPEASGIGAAIMLKITKSLIDGFKKTDSAFDEWVRNQGQVYSKRWIQPSILSKVGGKPLGVEAILFHQASELTRSVFRRGLGGSFDKHLTAKLSGLLYARLGAVAEKLRYDELMLKLDPNKLAEGYKGRSAERNVELAERKTAGKANSQIKKELAPALSDLVADAQQKNKANLKLEQLVDNKSPPTNNYHQTRLGVLLGCIEMIALGEKLTHAKLDWKSFLEVGGSAMAVGSIVLDTYYSAAKSIREISPYKDIKAINKSADIVRGGLKLGAGILSAGAGLFGSCLDYMKWSKEEDATLKWLYGLRAATGFLSSGLTLLVAFSYTESLFTHLAKGYAQHSIRYRAAAAAASVAARYAARVRLLVWVARLNWIGLALTAIEIGYLLLKDDELQNWCEKSAFRKEKKTESWLGNISNTEHFSIVTQELEQLNKATATIGLNP